MRKDVLDRLGNLKEEDVLAWANKRIA